MKGYLGDIEKDKRGLEPTKNTAFSGTVNSLVSCISCKKQDGKIRMHEIREASSRCGSFLCDECKREEDDDNRRFNSLCN